MAMLNSQRVTHIWPKDFYDVRATVEAKEKNALRRYDELAQSLSFFVAPWNVEITSPTGIFNLASWCFHT